MEEKMSFKELIHADFRAFMDDIEELTIINELLPRFIDIYRMSFDEKLEDRLKRLDDEERKQLKSLCEEYKSESITVTSKKAIEIYCSFIDTFTYPRQIADFIREMSLVYLVSSFESFLENILTRIFLVKPEILSSSKQISYEEVIRFKSIEELRNSLIEREIESIMRKT